MTKEHSEQIAAMGFTSEEMQRSKNRPRTLCEDFSQYKVPEEEIAAEEVFDRTGGLYHLGYPC